MNKVVSGAAKRFKDVTVGLCWVVYTIFYYFLSYRDDGAQLAGFMSFFAQVGLDIVIIYLKPA